jgi:hypothetical protein
MQINFRLLPVITLAVLTTFSSCKKESSKDDNTPTDPAIEVAAHSEDQNIVSDGLDAINNDVDAAVESSTDFNGGREMRLMNVCGADAVVDTFSNPKKITITYDGLNCFGTHTRNGVVVISMPQGMRWRDAGATLTISFQNLKIKRVSDNKSITYNGSQTYTNVSGGLLMALPTLNNIIHTVSSDGMTIKFDDNSERTWKVARKRTFTYNNGIVLSITGTHTEGSNTQIAEWGLNRFGHSFTTSITQPLVVRQDCNFRLTSGQVKHEGFATATATFGLNSDGNATTCPGTGHYYLRLEWTGVNGSPHHVILPY